MNTAAEDELWRVLRPILENYGLDPSVEGEGPDQRTVWVPTASGPRPMEVLLRRHAVASSRQEAAGSRIIAAPRISAGLGAQLRQQGIFYIDTAGNAFLDLPGYRLQVEGRTEHSDDFWQRQTQISTAFTPAGLRVLFALLVSEQSREASQRELAEAAGVSVGTTSLTIRALEGQRLILRDAGEVHLLDEERLRDLWIDHYIVRLAPKLRTRRFAGPPPHWWLEEAGEWSAGGTLGGETGLEQVGTDLVARETVLYGTPPWLDLVRLGRLIPDDQGNVVLREQFWGPTLLSDARVVPGLLLEADARAAADPRVQETAARLTRRSGPGVHDGAGQDGAGSWR